MDVVCESVQKNSVGSLWWVDGELLQLVTTCNDSHSYVLPPAMAEHPADSNDFFVFQPKLFQPVFVLPKSFI